MDLGWAHESALETALGTVAADLETAQEGRVLTRGLRYVWQAHLQKPRAGKRAHTHTHRRGRWASPVTSDPQVV